MFNITTIIYMENGNFLNTYDYSELEEDDIAELIRYTVNGDANELRRKGFVEDEIVLLNNIIKRNINKELRNI